MEPKKGRGLWEAQRGSTNVLVSAGLSLDQHESSAALENGRSREELELANKEAEEAAEEEEEKDLREAISKAEREAMEARADYVLRNKIIENVVIADPVLKAVHGGRDETFADRYVYSYSYRTST